MLMENWMTWKWIWLWSLQNDIWAKADEMIMPPYLIRNTDPSELNFLYSFVFSFPTYFYYALIFSPLYLLIGLDGKIRKPIHYGPACYYNWTPVIQNYLIHSTRVTCACNTSLIFWKWPSRKTEQFLARFLLGGLLLVLSTKICCSDNENHTGFNVDKRSTKMTGTVAKKMVLKLICSRL